MSKSPVALTLTPPPVLRADGPLGKLWVGRRLLLLGSEALNWRAYAEDAATLCVVDPQADGQPVIGMPRVRIVAAAAEALPLTVDAVDCVVIGGAAVSLAAATELRRILAADGHVVALSSGTASDAWAATGAALAAVFTSCGHVSNEGTAPLLIAAAHPVTPLILDLQGRSLLDATPAGGADPLAVLAQWRDTVDALTAQLEAERTTLRQWHGEMLDHQNAAEDLLNTYRRQNAIVTTERDTARAELAHLLHQGRLLGQMQEATEARIEALMARLETATAAHKAERVANRRANAALAAATADLKAAKAERAAAEARCEAAEAARDEALARPAVVNGGGLVLDAARHLGQQRLLEGNAVWRRISAKPMPKRPWARLTRRRPLVSVLQRHWTGRLALLLNSGLYAPHDGPGRRAILKVARGNNAIGPHPLFDPAWYLERNPDVARTGQNPALHYLLFGDREGRSPHPLFDARWYRDTYPQALTGWRLSSLEHYILVGARQGYNPHPLFQTTHYASQCPDLADTAANPLAHYLAIGWRQGRSPHPLFANTWYLERYPDTLSLNTPPLLHYVQVGAGERRQPHPLFDPQHYAHHNADVVTSMTDLLVHYLQTGWREGRTPSPDFDGPAYLAANPDVAAAGVEPLCHYLTQGAWEHRKGAGKYDEAAFLAVHGAKVLRGATPLEAYVTAGRPAAPRVADLTGGGAPDAGSATLFQALTDPPGTRDSYDWPAYVQLSRQLAADRRRQLEALHPAAPKLLAFAPGELAARARDIDLPAHDTPEVTILIPVFGQIKYTLECLTSLALAAKGQSITCEVIVADDASTDATAELLAQTRGVRVLRSAKNQGFLGNVNAAAAEARGRVLVILNNDVQVTPGWLEPLVKALTDPEIGAVAPKILFPDGRLQEAGARLRVDGTAHMIGLFDDPDAPRYGYPRDVDYVSGACLALRTADFAALGGFDLRYAPAYCEDADLCMRLRDKGLRIRYEPGSVVVHHLSVTSNSQDNTYKIRQVRTNQHKLYDRWQDLITQSNAVRTIALYLPQFHPIKENDAWWGPGFTEWRNVQRAVPNFAGHDQPRRPGELGPYDLTNPEIMTRQAELAQNYGLSGFCYYYYSFSGQRILERPLEQMLSTGKPDFPFCLCWANENWTRSWDGGDKQVLLQQSYTQEDDETVIRDVIRYMRRPNYIRVNGKPLFVLYRPHLLPDVQRTLSTWRRVCREEGIGEVYLCAMEVFELARTYKDPRKLGFDASIEFPPSGMSEKCATSRQMFNPAYTGTISDYRRIAQLYMRETIPGFTRFRGVMPSWDNTARRQNDAFIFDKASPGAFQAWLEAAIEATLDQNHGDERIVFINAWNEWAEGAHLEPDLRFGRGWLEALRNARESLLLLSKGQTP